MVAYDHLLLYPIHLHACTYTCTCMVHDVSALTFPAFTAFFNYLCVRKRGRPGSKTTCIHCHTVYVHVQNVYTVRVHDYYMYM